MGVISAVLLKEQIKTVLSPLFEMLANWVRGFLTMDLNKIRETLVSALGEKLGGTIAGFVELLHKAISGVSGFVAQLVGKESFDKIFGKGEFEKVSGLNEAFKTGADIASVLQDVWGIFVEFVGVLKADSPKQRWENIGELEDDVQTKIGDILLKLPGGDMLKEIWDKLMEQVKNWTKAMQSVYNTMFGEDGQSGAWGKVKDSIPKLADAIVNLTSVLYTVAVDIPTMLGNAINAIAAQAASQAEMEGGGVHNDFIMRPGQGAVNFSPSDTIIGVQNPGQLAGSGGGGGGNTFIINVYGNGERFIGETVRKEVEAINAKSSRYGFYQKGY
jgi:hypothetical protein